MLKRSFNLLALLLILAACSTTPAVPTPVAERPTAALAVQPTATDRPPAPSVTPVEQAATATEEVTAAVGAPTAATVTEEATAGGATAAATMPATDQPLAATDTATPSAPPVAMGEVRPITYTLPAGLQLVDSDRFASFRVEPVAVDAAVEAPPIAPDLANVAVPFILSPEQKALLGKQGFAISPGETREFFELYERARYNYEPVFVTSDSLLHVYHLLFDRTLRVAEEQQFIPMLSALDWALLNTSIEQLEALEGTPWATAARRNAAYFAVAVKLLNPDWTVPEGLGELVEPDLQAIEAHDAISPSAIFPAYPFGEDWSQYVPRGHYTRSEALGRYFRAMMWHGRITLRQKDEIESQQAALMTQAWRATTVENKHARGVWDAIYEPTVFFVGRADDLTPTEYDEPFTAIYGDTADPRALADAGKFAAFRAAVAELRPPEILGMVITDQMDVEEETKGLRFMGQRFVPDSFIFRQLIHRNVEDRYLPKGLDLFAAMGSERALEHLEPSGDAAMPGYREQLDKVRQIVAGYDEPTWTQNLYWSWLHTLRPSIEPAGPGYPQFMRSAAWTDKQLNTLLGSWTELRHDTLLYAKQVYAEGGAGGLQMPTPEPPKGYVEPVPELYARLGALASMTIEGLKQRGLLLEADEQALQRMVDLAASLRVIAEKELRGEALTAEEYEQIRRYGVALEQLTFAAGLEAGEQPGGQPASDAPQAAVVADVATNPNDGTVLEEGVGRVFPIYVVAPIEGKLTVTVGGVFSHYEFVHPLSDRLTDERWQAMLDEGQAPPFEPWKQALMVEATPATALADTIRGFNDKLAEALWLTDIAYVTDYLVDPELADTRGYIDQLKQAGQFVGLKRMALDYLSFDFQDDTHATVTTRERFEEELREGSPVDYSTEPPVVGRRPAYETTVAYTMVKQGETWKIERIVVNNPPGAWQP